MQKGSIKDIRVPVQVVIGETEMTVAEIATMGPGRIVGLNVPAGEPVYLTAAGEKVARGEVVIIDENFGIRITQIINGEA